MVSLHSYPYMGTSHTASSIMAKRIFFVESKHGCCYLKRKKIRLPVLQAYFRIFVPEMSFIRPEEV
ncbi:hypothetical protein ACH33_12305 [Aneurinibacillus sp. XH2]|nr:hypothetical protein ACH33_12305 [Aneurinibacillus sp. XH2]